MTKHPLAVVSLLAFLIGGTAAVILNYPPRHTPAPPQVAEMPADAGHQTAADTDTPAAQPAAFAHAEGGATSEEFDDPAAPTEEASTEGEAAVVAERRSGVARARSATYEQAARSSQAPRPYVRVSRRESTPGGARVAAYTVGGVKKTGQGVKKAGTTIGRTFGKIGGVFND